MLYAGLMFSESRRWLASLQLIGLWLGLPNKEAAQFAVVAALGPLADDDLATSNRPIWRSDANGQCIDANEAAMAVVGGSPLDANWMRTMEVSERLDIGAQWQEAVTRGRTFRATYHFHHGGRAHRVEGLALPVGMGSSLLGYEGQLRVL